MGVIIRPPEFARSLRAEQRAPDYRARARRTIRALRAHRLDVRLMAVIMAVVAVAWILALAGAAFTVRTLLVLCFATLAGRARRVGVQAGQPVRIRPRRGLSAIR